MPQVFRRLGYLRPIHINIVRQLMDTVMRWIEILGGAAALLAIVYYAAQKVAEMAISKVVEDYKAHLNFDAKRREKAALVADLLSEWLKKPMDKDKVNRLLWEASMWLPENEAKDLNNLLAHAGSITTKQMIVRIRSVIQGKDTILTADDITHFE
jgi:hypothetical protein